MKTLKELEVKINNVETTLSSLKDELEELKKSKPSFEPTPRGWQPRKNEVYYYANNRMYPRYEINEDTVHDEFLIKYNRLFKTEKECQIYCNIQKAFIDASKEFKYYKKNCYPYLHVEDANIDIAVETHTKSAMLYFDSEETIQKLIDKFGEENVKKYFLGVY